MREKGVFLAVIIFFLNVTAIGFPEDYTLQYFLVKLSAKEGDLSKEERGELFNRIDGVLRKAEEVHRKLDQAIQGGEITMEYQEGRFWMTKLDEDRDSIAAGKEHVMLLKEKPDSLTSSLSLYKSLRDLSINFSAYNNAPLLCSYTGDVAPEIGLWADPVFYKLHLLPLVALKEKEMEKPLPAKETEKPSPTKEKLSPSKKRP